MSLLAQFIKTYTIFFLVSCLTIFTNEVHAQAARDFFWMDDITTVRPLETSTGAFQEQEQDRLGPKKTFKTPDAFQEQDRLGPKKTFKTPDDFEGIKETTTTETYTPTASGCSFPPRLDYAQPRDSYLSQTTFSKGSNVNYNCRPGYVRVPGVRIYATCLEDGTWSNPGIFCKRRSCGNPGEAENAEMTADDDFSFGSKVTYVCNPGYRMTTRRKYRECLADGTWSNALPECAAQLCPPPPDIINGVVYPLKDEYSYLDSVTYSCNRNLALIGESSVSCKEDGEWSSNAPDCKVVNCLNPHVPNAIKISGTSGPYNLNSVVRFVCPTSTHVLNGSDTIKCNQNSEWEPTPPRCLGVCRYVPEIYFAEPVEPTRENFFVQGTTLQFKCKEGYKPVPDVNNVLTCSGRTWTSHKTFCIPIYCGNPGPISNGHIQTGTFFFGSGVTYECRIGYTIIGDGYRRCQADGTWSLPIPECEVKICPYPNITPKTSFIPVKIQYQYGDKLTYNCSEGYQLTGESESVCNHEGRWSPKLPSCRGICNAPKQLEYAQLNEIFLDGKTFFQNDKVLYTCRKGYSRNYEYNNTLICLGNFKWSHPEPFCSRISCGPPETITNAVYEAKNFLFGSEAVYKCEKGYNMVLGNNTRKCLDTKKWSDPIPKCEVQTCPPPEDLVNGSYSVQKKIYTYLDSVTYKCDHLNLVGEALVSCTAEGTWTSGAPECKAVCNSPSELGYGELVETFSQKHYFNVGTSLKYKCRPGYISTDKASNEITCGPDLKWSEPEVFCERLSCDNPGDIANGQMQFKDFLFESRVTYTCKPGYTMISKRNYRSCQADETWSGTPPVCKASICDNIWELQEEARKCTSTPDEWIKYLQVQYLYLQIENLKLDIDIKKKKLSAEKKQENWARK
ncbi:C4b-binding protein alpha chain-like isoform X2 [Rana temporaria]|uniref:C4b-binding protein alpha chain-like isoform X2 n=1 Tax=Rana temporaria TaxID=8407 RepID=UPI001AAD4AC5|nr:C4b-binding protein alpha chain-like isoform X2 [Rana temporaria]